MEHTSVVAINVGLSRGPLGVDHVVRRHLDMEVADWINPSCYHNGDTVYQLACWYKDVIEAERMLGRNIEIALRYTIGQRAGADQHWRKVQIDRGKRTRVTAPSDPFDRLGVTITDNDQFANCQFLYGLFAGISQNAGTSR